jgi:hypothetical protein
VEIKEEKKPIVDDDGFMMVTKKDKKKEWNYIKSLQVRGWFNTFLINLTHLSHFRYYNV